MTAQAMLARLEHLRGGWRGPLALLIVAQLALLREISEGRFLVLLRGGETVAPLWYLHTASKVTLLAGISLIFAALVERRLSGPPLVGRNGLLAAAGLHGAAFVGLVVLIPGLPTGWRGSMLADLATWRYAAVSGAFLAWQGTALLLIAPRGLFRQTGARAAVFVGCGIVTALLLASERNLAIDALRALVEDATLSLSLAFYAVIGDAQPALSFREGTPVLSAEGFAILVSPVCAGYQGMLAAGTVMAGLIALDWSGLQRGRAVALAVVTVALVFTLNAVRIALLFHIGVAHSPEMAVEGFHSYFGTLSLLAVVGLAMLALQHPLFRRGTAGRVRPGAPPRGQEGEAALLILPLAVYLGVGMLVGLFGTGFNWAYPLTALVGLALIALWRRRIAAEFAGGPGLSGFAMGFAVFALWLALVPPDPAADAEAAAALAAAPASVVVLWMALRLVGFTLVVPVLEELAFRGGLFRLVTARLTARIGHRGAAGAALAASAIAFGALHSQLLAGTLAGLGFGVLVLRTGRTGDAIIAHAVTNFLLAVSAIVTGHWSLW
jgi:exosortase E/protease (VPEID-CTERM system)